MLTQPTSGLKDIDSWLYSLVSILMGSTITFCGINISCLRRAGRGEGSENQPQLFVYFKDSKPVHQIFKILGVTTMTM